MIKNIALSAIFAVVSIISFSSSSVNAAKLSKNATTSMGAPVMKGIPACGGSWFCK